MLDCYSGMMLAFVTFIFIACLASVADSVAFGLIDLDLADASTGQIIYRPTVDVTIDLAEFPTNTGFAILANVAGNPKFVNFTLLVGTTLTLLGELTSQPTRTSTFIDLPPRPFAMGGKTADGKLKPVAALNTPGKYVLEVTLENNLEDIFRLNIEVLARSRVANFTLVDTVVGRDIAPLFHLNLSSSDYFFFLFGWLNPYQIDASLIPANISSTIRANTVGQVGSVEFKLFQNNTAPSNGTLLVSTIANKAPFTLGGMSRRGKLIGVPALEVSGNYSFQVTAYRNRFKRGGLAGPQQLINFVVLPRLRVVDFTLVNVATGKDLLFSRDYGAYGITGCTAFPPLLATGYDIRANVGYPVNSVEFVFSHRNGTFLSTHVDNEAPFSLGQPYSKGRPYGVVPGLTDVKASYILTATAYSARDKGGLKSLPFEIRFFVRLCVP